MRTIVVDVTPKFIKEETGVIEIEENFEETPSRLNTIKKVIYCILTCLIIIIAVPTVVSILPIKDNFELFVVQSGSMAPTIKTGSLTVSKPVENYEIGDIITYASTYNPKQMITHRIADAEKEGNIFLTKGDANEDVDPMPVKFENIKGKLLFWVPYLGYPIGFAKTYQGLILLVIIPSTIIVYDEFLSLKKSLFNLAKNRHEKNY